MKIINNIRKLSIKDYEDVINSFVKKFSKFNVSLYLFGNIKHPSISDLDLIIVYEDSISNEELESIIKAATNFTKSNDNTKYIFTHPILIYPRSLFKNIKYLHSIQNIQKLFGKNIDLNTPNKIENEILNSVHFLNFTYHVIFWLKTLLNKEDVYLRELLLGLNSAKHSLTFLKNFNKKNLEKDIYLLEKVRNDFSIIKEININSLISKILQLFNEFSADFMNNIVNVKNSTNLFSFCYLFNISEKYPVKIPFSVILHGASYYKVHSQDKYFYTKIHKLLYPFFDYEIISKEYRKVIEIQIETAVKFETLYKNYKITPLIPLMCNYCVPNLTPKRKLLLNLNKLLIKIPFSEV